MSNQQKVWSKVTRKLKKTMKGIPERYIVVWGMMVSGIVLKGCSRLSSMAAALPTRALEKSSFRRLQRFVSNPHVDAQAHYLPFAQQILQALSVNRLVFAMDSSQVANNCMVLLIGVVYRNRLLPITWIVYQGKKGHTTAQKHIEVLELLQPLLPTDSEVVLLGDGEFDNVPMLQWVEEHTDWKYVVRTAKSSQVFINSEQFRMDSFQEEGYITTIKYCSFTNHRYGPITAVVWWEEGYEKPLYLISNCEETDKICSWYQKRFLIETLFSDQKSRGFGVDKSHLSCPEKVSRLMVAVCISYLWMVWYGEEAERLGKIYLIGHKYRCDKSIFRIGLDWFGYLLKHGLSVSVDFKVAVNTSC